jgi:hypothetical protein
MRARDARGKWKEQDMETLMAGTAIFEVFLASLGMSALMATLALRGAFWLMHGAGIGRQPTLRLAVRTVPGAAGSAGRLMPVPVRSVHRIG